MTGKLLDLAIVYVGLLQIFVLCCCLGSLDHDEHLQYESTHYASTAPPRLVKNIRRTFAQIDDTYFDGFKLLDVQLFGAKGDGVTDDTQAFVMGWDVACKRSSAPILHVPKEKEFVLLPTSFQGPCQGPVSVQVDGNITAPRILTEWSSQDSTWIEFKNMDGLVVNGSGLINGRGENWWSCAGEKTKYCPSAMSPPSLLKISNSNDVMVEGLTFIHSQRMHIVFDSCKGVTASNLHIVFPASSANTDGIHLLRSSNIQIRNCTVSTLADLLD